MAKQVRLLTQADVERLRRNFAAMGDELPPEIVAGAPWPRSRLLDEDLHPVSVRRTPERVKSDDKYIVKLLEELGFRPASDD